MAHERLHEHSHEHSIDGSGATSALVLFSDELERLGWLVSAFELEGFRVINIATAEALSALAHHGISLVVLDAEPTQLLPALAALRVNPYLLEATALVRGERLNDLATIAGVCPSYRALICYHEDLIKLIKHHAQHWQPPSYQERKHLI